MLMTEEVEQPASTRPIPPIVGDPGPSLATVFLIALGRASPFGCRTGDSRD